MWSSVKSYRYFRPTGSSLMQNHTLRRATVLGSMSASGTWVQYWWRSHWRAARAIAAGGPAGAPFDHTTVRRRDLRRGGGAPHCVGERRAGREAAPVAPIAGLPPSGPRGGAAP